MMTRLTSFGALSCASLVLALAGCGGSKPPAAAPSPAPAKPAASATQAAPAPAPSASASAAPASTSTASAPESSSSNSPGEALGQTPIELLTQSGEAFVVDFDGSDVGAKTKKACQSSKPARAAKCREHKRSKFLADMLQFKKHKDGKLTFTIYKRRGDRVTRLSTDNVKLKQKSAHSVAVQVIGKGHGTRVLFIHSRKFVVTVPNDYSLQLQDPRYGKLVYDGKVDVLKQ